MFVTLIKIASRLDKLGEHDLATELDKVIQDLVQTAGFDKEKLEQALKDIEKQLEKDLGPERMGELHKRKKEIEEDLEKTDKE